MFFFVLPKVKYKHHSAHFKPSFVITAQSFFFFFFDLFFLFDAFSLLVERLMISLSVLLEVFNYFSGFLDQYIFCVGID